MSFSTLDFFVLFLFFFLGGNKKIHRHGNTLGCTSGIFRANSDGGSRTSLVSFPDFFSIVSVSTENRANGAAARTTRVFFAVVLRVQRVNAEVCCVIMLRDRHLPQGLG